MGMSAGYFLMQGCPAFTVGENCTATRIFCLTLEVVSLYHVQVSGFGANYTRKSLSWKIRD